MFLAVPESAIGKKIRCPKCQGIIVVAAVIKVEDIEPPPNVAPASTLSPPNSGVKGKASGLIALFRKRTLAEKLAIGFIAWLCIGVVAVSIKELIKLWPESDLDRARRESAESSQRLEKTLERIGGQEYKDRVIRDAAFEAAKKQLGRD